VKLTIAISRNLETLRSTDLTGVDILAFPELFNCKFDENTFEILIPTSEIIAQLELISSQYPDLVIIGGSLPSDAGEPHIPGNESSIIKKGEIIHSVQKIHQFKPYREDKLFRAGEYVGPYAVKINEENLGIGIAICYDLRFPELSRRLAFDGMDILFVPAIWSIERDTAWRTLLAARAIENQVFSVGINSLGKSYCFSPTGEMRFGSEEVVDFEKFEIDTSEISELKKFIDTIGDSRLLP